MAPTIIASVARGLQIFGVAVGLMILAAAPVGAQAISGHSGSTSGSTANGGGGNTSVRSSRASLIANSTTFQSRYAWNISADVGVGSNSTSNGSSQHNMSFNVTAPGGYRLDIAQQRQGMFQRNADVSGCSGAADISSLTGSQGGGTITSGSLSLADPGGIGNGGGNTQTPFNQLANASIGAVSNGGAVGHTLTFTWNGTTRSNSCEAAVRMGEGSSVSGCGACVYPGSPSRTQANDGHFVTVSLVNLCGNGVVDSGSPWLEQCDTGIAGSVCCNSNCRFNSGAVCRASAGVCDPQETCSGSSASCPANALSSSATVCRASAGVCDIAENCTGSGAACPANGFASGATVCRGSAGVCDVAENCTGSSAACPADGFASAATVCRGSAGVCDVAENCTGGSASCPANGFASAATVCRGSAGVCDAAENCTGSGTACPADGFQSNATVCRASAGICDTAENCTGSGTACPADAKSTAVCRGSAGVCDVAESCDGVANGCPADGFESSATVCRPEAGICDVAESCTGTGAACPSDAVEPSATECRAVAGICDVAENCDGVAVACPTDAFESSAVTCRAVADVCDVAESCTGSGAACPTDAFASSATVCRAASDVCDTTESCTGSGAACPADAVEPTTTVCRPDAGDCDVQETCDGAAKACPSDAFEGNGTICNDGDYCLQTDLCDGAGTCVGSNPVNCDDVNPCTDDACDSQGGGFLCEYVNNGLCIGANCGNFVVDAGETCDPPNLALDPTTNQIECRLDCTACGDGVVQANNVETCDDGNTVSGCRTDKPQKPLDSCLNNCNEPICADPARIKFGVHELPDLFSFHGRLISDVPVDFVNNHFVIELRDATGGVIYRSSLLNGSIEVQNVKSVRYKNRGARDGGGVYQLKTKAGAGYYVLTLKAYGDLSASVADMSTHVYIGSDEWVVRGMWTAQGSKGWKLSNKQTFLPVP